MDTDVLRMKTKISREKIPDPVPALGCGAAGGIATCATNKSPTHLSSWLLSNRQRAEGSRRDGASGRSVSSAPGGTAPVGAARPEQLRNGRRLPGWAGWARGAAGAWKLGSVPLLQVLPTSPVPPPTQGE